MTEAHTITILCTIKDPTCLTLQPQTDGVVGILKEFMPDKDIPTGAQVLGAV